MFVTPSFLIGIVVQQVKRILVLNAPLYRMGIRYKNVMMSTTVSVCLWSWLLSGPGSVFGSIDKGKEGEHSLPSWVLTHPSLPAHSHSHRHNCYCCMAAASSQDSVN